MVGIEAGSAAQVFDPFAQGKQAIDRGKAASVSG
jgi:hypothetical protein